MIESPIFDAIEREAHRIDQWFTRHHDGGHVTPVTTENTTTKGTHMSVLTDIHDTVASGLANIEGWASDLKEKLPEITARAAKLDASPIIQALEAAVLPPDVEQAIAALIRHYAPLPQQAMQITFNGDPEALRPAATEVGAQLPKMPLA